MNDYFQRLVQQSELQVRQASAVPSPAAPAPAMPPIDLGASDDLVEIHDERVVDFVAPAPRQARTVDSNSTPIAIGVEATDPEQTAPATSKPSNGGTAPSPTPDIVEQHITITPPATTVRESASPTPVIPAATERVTAPTPVAPPRATPPPLPSELMDAVMKWIAAGSVASQPATPPPSAEASVPATTVAKASDSRPEAPARREYPAEKIPERVIRLVEAEPAPSRESHPIVTARPITPATPRATSPAAEAPVRVSIGSIQVNVEAPAPAAPKSMRTSRPAEPARTPSRTNRSSMTSQLRRHYIIPH